MVDTILIYIRIEMGRRLGIGKGSECIDRVVG
jgi:hypothetical protein